MNPPNIRDPDLLEKLAKTETESPAFRDTHIRALERMQADRDRAAAEAEAKRSALAAMPREQRRRAIIREVIQTEGPAPDGLRFLPTPLAICGLPYRRLAADKREFERRQGRMSVVVTAGWLMDPSGERVQQPIPWGPKARLIMAHLSTEALRNDSPIVETADTLSGFMHDMGFTVTGGERGSLAPFKEQLRALAACRMEFSAWDGTRSAMVDVKPLEKVELWFGEDPAQRSLWPSKIEFSRRYFDELKNHALPIDIRALKAFSGSARRLDLLFWITYRITRLNDHFVLDWKPLKEQFGEGFARDRDFRAHLAEDLASIKELFPKLPVKLTARGLEMDQADSTALAIPKRTLISRKS
ncbi:hypothetical protein NS365_18625 [Aureimonas ureilytica]|uniref:Pirin n=1 Tax=Aureimonas ureilytica TaxID=401562 RepID=A0A175R6U8_9HYPH|nr:replication protein RepA [Aureimonas ureilytica]KTQ95029.1 hypothetical protein NS226_13610 [Aureimonas ureilytica]KTR03361.1 hypothetical protein NS365_18625 [Aureimonas ureilytica]